MINNFERANREEFLEKSAELNSEVQTAIETVKEIRIEAEKTILEGRKELKEIEQESGLSKEQIEKASADFHLAQQMTENEGAINQLAEKTLEKVRVLVEILADDISPAEIDKIMADYGIKLEAIGQGAFYDTFEIEGTDEVLKVLKLNYLFSQEQAARILARHAHEARRFKKYFGDEFIPPTVFIYPEKMKEFFGQETRRIESDKVALYDLLTFSKIQIDRRLQAGYARRDVVEERKGIDKAFGILGQTLKGSSIFRNECAGVVVEKRIRGITFAELMAKGSRGGDLENWDELRDNVIKFLKNLLNFNKEYLLLWHRFDSDNVLLETDESGNLTGGIKIIDLNFTEKPLEIIRKKMVPKMNNTIINPLLKYFEVDPEEVYNSTESGQ